MKMKLVNLKTAKTHKIKKGYMIRVDLESNLYADIFVLNGKLNIRCPGGAVTLEPRDQGHVRIAVQEIV